MDQAPGRQAALAEPCAGDPGAPVHVVALAHLIGLLGKIERLGAVPQDHVVGLVLRLIEDRECWIVFQGTPQGIELAKQSAPLRLLIVAEAGRNDSFHHELLLHRVASRGKRHVARSQKTGFRKSSLRLGKHDVGWDQPLVAGLVASEQGDHCPDAWVHQPIAGTPAGLRQIGCRLVAVVAVSHAADERVLVGLLGQQREQLADADAVHVGGDRVVQWPAIVVACGRFGVECVHVRWPTGQPDLDDRLGLGRFGFGGPSGAAGHERCPCAVQAVSQDLTAREPRMGRVAWSWCAVRRWMCDGHGIRLPPQCR